MAKNEIVWGIDVGNTSLKALRCRAGSEPGTVEVLGFDFIEHSKVMSQPGADASEILAESLALFLSRNNIKGEKIAIAVSGQSALWRFQALPPVDPRKIRDLVKYEVRQWLPFDLDDVIWSYRQVGGVQEGNILLDTNIFMYAMKKELTQKTLASYSKNGIEVDCLQGAPIALYNGYVNDLYDPEELEGKDPSELTEFDILLNVGTDTTEVVITNGIVVWLRNIPIGGNLFTKSLTKTLKLTFTNAEHIKRNAATSQDPKAVILAMKPVFNEMLSEIDRSIKYYCSLNKRAKIRKIYALGNAMKLPGLRQFLAKSHGIDVVVPTQFQKLRGPEVLANPQFTDNLSSFAVAYGLALNLLGKAPLDINLIPGEVVRERLINSKKPWALAAAALLMLAMTIQYVSATVAYRGVDNDAFTSAYNSAKQVNDLSKKVTGSVTKEVSAFKSMDAIGKNLTSNVEGRLTWLELIRTLNTLFPAESLPPEVFSQPSREKAAAIMRQDRVYIDNIEVYKCSNLSSWFESVRQWYTIDDVEAEWFKEDSAVTLEEGFGLKAAETPAAAGGGSMTGKKSGGLAKKAPAAKKSAAVKPAAAKPAAGKTAAGGKKGAAAAAPAAQSLTSGFVESKDERLAQIPAPTGAGRIVQLNCYHYHNPDDINEPNRGPEYVRRVFLPRIKHGSIELPVSLERQRKEGAKSEVWTLKEFGIGYPVMVNPGFIDDNYRLLDPEAALEEYRKIRESSIKNKTGSTTAPTGRSGRTMGGGMGGGGGAMPGLNQIADNLSQNGVDKVLNLRRFDFVVQFVWIETPPSLRESRRKAELEKNPPAAEGEAADAAGTTGTAGTANQPAGNATTGTTEGAAANAQGNTQDQPAENASGAEGASANGANDQPAANEAPANGPAHDTGAVSAGNTAAGDTAAGGADSDAADTAPDGPSGNESSGDESSGDGPSGDGP